MLVLKRKEGQWVNVRHKSGDLMRFRVYEITSGTPGRVSLAFDDDARNFDVQRPEREHRARSKEKPRSDSTTAD